jgi:DNA-binding CsgD family transcriptional regulator
VTVPIASLLAGEPLRSAGCDVEHVMLLAGLESALPPILVERRTMRVIDGLHRLMAAFMRGHQTIEVEFFDGPAEDAFLRAVEANVSHGLPLSLADRRSAVERIVSSHPTLSDRAIARIAGVGAKAVAAARRRSTAPDTQSDGRVGQDGRVRPANGALGRLRVAELIAQRPDASARELARIAGVSPATASDVRKRLRAGVGPLPDRAAATPPADPDRAAAAPSGDSDRGVAQSGRDGSARSFRLVQADPAQALEKLLRDPSLRHNEEGRQLLRLLRQNSLRTQEWSELTAAVPPHCSALVVSLARQYAATWQGFAQELDERVRSLSHRQEQRLADLPGG